MSDVAAVNAAVTRAALVAGFDELLGLYGTEERPGPEELADAAVRALAMPEAATVVSQDFRTDPHREAAFPEGTGVYIRAIGMGGRWGTYDMAQLDRDSFVWFVRSRGAVSTWALHLLLILLDHPRDGVE